MTYDMNDVQPQIATDIIPDGTFAKISMIFKPGTIDGANPADAKLLKHSNSPGSDVQQIDAEFTVAEGLFARRKFWQFFTVIGGKTDEQGVSIGWKITKSTFRSMIDSALGLDPQDMSEDAKSKRLLEGLSQMSGITFIGKIKIEPSDNPRYPDRNRLDRVVLPNEPEWQKVMNGEQVPPAPSARPRAAAKPEGEKPAWGQGNGAVPGTAAKPTWGGALSGTAAPAAPSPQAQASTPAPSAKPGPAWLAG
jgi:hypothetical protein